MLVSVKNKKLQISEDCDLLFLTSFLVPELQRFTTLQHKVAKKAVKINEICHVSCCTCATGDLENLVVWAAYSVP